MTSKVFRLHQYCYLIITTILIFCNVSFSQDLAFPSAKGAGAYATGGRGGQVLHITTLAWDAGPGSLRHALFETTGPRTIVFDVSGEIDATGYGGFGWAGGVPYDNFTIAGQTAPEGGITILTDRFTIRGTNNFIIRYVRFRKSTATANMDVFATQDCSNFILDHVTFSNGSDECIDINSFNGTGRGTSDITVQNCFFQDSKTGAIIGDGASLQTGNFTLVDNLWANISHRHPNCSGGANSRHDVVNNVVYNNNYRTISVTTNNTRINSINNYLKPSANGKGASSDLRWDNMTAYTGIADNSIYASGNYIVTSPSTTDQEYMWQVYPDVQTQIAPSKFTNTQHTLVGEPFTIKTPQQAYDDITADLGGGANKYLNADGTYTVWQDQKDSETINMVINDSFGTEQDTTTPFPLGTYFNVGGFITRYSNVGWAPIPNNSRVANFYQSNSHIPEAYLVSRGITGNVDIHNQIQPSGYTLLEEYLNGVDNANIEEVLPQSVTVTPQIEMIEVNQTIQLTASFTPSNTTNQMGSWSSSDTSIAEVDSNGLVTGIMPGDVLITFTSNVDADVQSSSQITVFAEALVASAGNDQQICIGETVTLTASGGPNFLWDNGETTASIEVSPTETTIYTVTVSDNDGNFDEDSVTVIVNAIPVADAGEDQTICEGDTVTLTANGGDIYLWNTGETSQSIEISPTAETTYTVEVISNDCSSTDSVTVFVNEAPNISVSDDVVIVEGNSTTLNVTGSDNYLWSTGETTPFITVSPLVTTTYSVTSLHTNGCSRTEEITVTVEELLVVSAGEDEFICQDDDYEIVLTSTPGDSYLWNTGETTQSIVVSPIATSTYTVTVTQGTQQDTDDVTVFVDPNPNVVILNGDSIDIMSGDFVTLSATGANSYQWNNGATQPNIAVSPSQTTIYEVRGYINDCYDEKQVTVNVIPEVVANAGEDVEICIGETVTLTATGGDEYVWSNGETTQTIQVSPTETTEYTVTVFNPLDFDEDSVTVYVDTNCEEDINNPVNPGNGDPQDFDFSIYPNPSTDFVNVKLAGSTALSRIYLYDVTGKLIHSEIISNDNLNMSTTRRIDVSRLHPGIYFIKLEDVTQEISKKLIVR